MEDLSEERLKTLELQERLKNLLTEFTDVQSEAALQVASGSGSHSHPCDVPDSELHATEDFSTKQTVMYLCQQYIDRLETMPQSLGRPAVATIL